MNRFSDRRIVDFCRKSSGFADFENTADRGSARYFGVECAFLECSEFRS